MQESQGNHFFGTLYFIAFAIFVAETIRNGKSEYW